MIRALICLLFLIVVTGGPTSSDASGDDLLVENVQGTVTMHLTGACVDMPTWSCDYNGPADIFIAQVERDTILLGPNEYWYGYTYTFYFETIEPAVIWMQLPGTDLYQSLETVQGFTGPPYKFFPHPTYGWQAVDSDTLCCITLLGDHFFSEDLLSETVYENDGTDFRISTLVTRSPFWETPFARGEMYIEGTLVITGPTSDAVPVRRTSWGAIKTLYR